MLDYRFSHYDYTYQCQINYNGITFFGEAKCHPDDYDMCSERTGYFIAETRANLAKLRYCRDHEIMPMVKHYKHFYDCISHSSKFNKESYETEMIYREKRKWEKALEAIRDEIKHNREYLRQYIADKEKLHNKIRQGKSN
jgi:hypothetical protein